MSTAWFQCLAGASGDMLLGALVDAGAGLDEIRRAVATLGLRPFEIDREQVTRGGMAATRVRVHTPDTTTPRRWADIRRMLADSPLPPPVRARALDAFMRLAQAEADVHRIAPEEVHFHEVGALDAIIDIVGTSTALHTLGISRAVGSAVAMGTGFTNSAHGLLPVPTPAALALLAEAGAPVCTGSVPHELCTPTGAALLAATCTSWGDMPPMRVAAIGMGAGARDLTQLPNLLRVVIGDEIELDAPARDVILIEANVDDLDPRIWPDVISGLLARGAMDAWLTPVLMKKGRPAHTLSVLADPGKAADLRHFVFTETSTIGLRQSHVSKFELRREFHIVNLDSVDIRVKVSFVGGRPVNTQPEYADVVAAARVLGRPVKAVLAQVTGAFRP
jgi:pyridinium-3,5-bisthiocarboxylic acid mononucleotide nickel chelatase